MKKVLFSLFIVVSCFVFSSSVNAYTLDNQYYFQLGNMSGRTLEEDLFFGTSDIMLDYNIPSSTVVVNNIRNTLVARTESSNFDDFLDNYYYTVLYKYDSINNVLSNQVYYTSKENGVYNYDVLVYSNGVLNNTSNHKQLNFYPHISQQEFSDSNKFFSVGPNGNILSYPVDMYFDFYYSTTNSVPSWRTTTTDGQNIVWLNMGYYLDTQPIYMFFDTNFDCNFNYNIPQVSAFNSKYVASTLRIYPNDYDLGDTIFTDTSWFYFDAPNIQDLGNNSFGINFNALNNNISSLDDSFVPIDILCPTDRDFLNGVCNVYSSDFTNFSTSFTNFNNQIFYYFGRNSGVTLVSDKYYILTIRLYTSYNLKPTAMVFHFSGDSTDYPVNDIYKVVVNDYSLYKDIQIVFDMPSGINNDISFFTILFDNMSNYTNSIDSNYNFGVYKTIKLSEYSSLPDSTQIDSDYSNNNLTTISNNDNSSFFTNFSLNDYGLSTVILLPLNYVRNLSNNTCVPIPLTIPKIGVFNLPCISSFMTDNFNSIWSIFKVVVNGLIVYRIIVNLFSTIKNMYKPDNDSIEVIDL